MTTSQVAKLFEIIRKIYEKMKMKKERYKQGLKTKNNMDRQTDKVSYRAYSVTIKK